ncbi:hypothetical protein L9W92_15935 [Pelotomaculum terephthalicicum JT]|uniref:hypothetical protein n=1 Tax=Pelotomaculum terephthalicicum TaxID=206393 RepID=UPI0009D02BDF|nr:hypothetical protein [Pelotomaculum terephthalicicum]MCG9969496.1 hypothetical protein [Pelotomaculum terephthalicicum JT]OPX84903.1 MAG: hypothetical protein A4E54_02747 [Pelotomaculum sp. PtaB.Bin117]OPY61862.1 MAG: hypothetical protein A4E56_01739 [Pelotomaculum sp. PtaU1.Bin065]
MLARLKANKGKKIILELTNGRILNGAVIAIDQEFVSFETDSGVGTIPISTVQIIWEPLKRSLSEENMEVFAQKLRDYKEQIACTGAQFMGSDPQAEIACTGFPAFTCRQSYICRPPDLCSFSFACPGRYVPGPPSAGGGCPIFLCGPFQFGQPCGPFQFGCRPFVFGCGPFQFGQPCGPFQFGLPCGPFQFGGSQCGVLGGFACPGQQFIGVAGPQVGSPSGAPGSPYFPGAQFAEAPVQSPGMVSGMAQETHMPPMDFSVKEDKDNK